MQETNLENTASRFFSKDLSNFANFNQSQQSQQYNEKVKDTLKVECKNQQNPNFSSFVSVGDESTHFSRISTQNSESLQRSSKTINNHTISNNMIFDEEEEENQNIYLQNNNPNTINTFYTNKNDKNNNNNNSINFANALENNKQFNAFQQNKQLQSRFQNFFIENSNKIDIQNQLLLKYQQQYESSVRQNPQHVVQYQKEIISYLLKIENNYTPKNLPISTEQRGALVDWLINHQIHLKLKCETLHISIYIMDQYLERKYIQTPNINLSVSYFYLIACTALFMAAKYEEIYPPSLDQFCNQMNFNKQDIINCEGKILNLIGFTLTAPTSLKFLEAFALIDSNNINTNQIALAQFLIQLALHHSKFLYIKPSLIASVSILIAKKLFDLNSEIVWSKELTEYTSYKQEDLEDLGNLLFLELISIQSSPGSSVCIKFSTPQFQSITQQIPILLQKQMQASTTQNNNQQDQQNNNNQIQMDN